MQKARLANKERLAIEWMIIGLERPARNKHIGHMLMVWYQIDPNFIFYPPNYD